MNTAAALMLATLALLMAWSPPTAASRIDWGPLLRVQAGLGLADPGLEQFATEASLWGRARLGPTIVQGQVLARHETEDRLEPGRPDDGLRSPINPRHLLGDHAEWALRELFVDLPWRGANLRIGKQQIVWGNSDGIKYLDLINPQSFSEFISAPQDQSRIPLWSLQVQRELGPQLGVDLLLIPDLSLHDIPEPGALYEITSPLLSPQGAATTPPDLDTLALALDRLLSTPGNGAGLEAASDPLLTALLPLLDPLDPLLVPLTPAALRAALAPRLRFDSRRPSLRADTLELGLRARFRIGALEAALIGFRHFADVPRVQARVSAEEVVITRNAVQSHTAGLAMSHPAGALLLRAELLYTRRAPLPVVDFEGDGRAGDAPSGAMLIGADALVGDGHFISVQVGGNRFLPAPELPVDIDSQTFLSALWRTEWAAGTLVSEVFAIVAGRHGDAYLRPRLMWRASDQWGLGAGLDLYTGEANGVFGQFDARDRVLLQLQWSPS